MAKANAVPNLPSTPVVQAPPAAAALTNAQLLAQVQQLQAALTQAQLQRPGNSTLPLWQGHSTTALLRAMQKLGYSPGSALRILVVLGIVPSPATCQTQYQLARKGKAGAVLTAAQQAYLQAVHTTGKLPVANA